MPKRFTDSDKWKDKWFRALRPELKLAYLYLLDNCDHAGVIEIDEELANFQIGTAIDWSGFLDICGDRIAHLDNGKMWLTKFIDFQYGELSRECRAHSPVFQSIEKNRLSIGYPKGINTLKDKDKDKDIDKDTVKDKDRSAKIECGNWVIPERLDCEQIRLLLSKFLEMRRRIKKPVKDLVSTSVIFNRFENVEHLAYALETCIANDYQGIKPEYKPFPASKVATTFAQQRVKNTEQAIREFVNGQ